MNFFVSSEVTIENKKTYLLKTKLTEIIFFTFTKTNQKKKCLTLSNTYKKGMHNSCPQDKLPPNGTKILINKTKVSSIRCLPLAGSKW